MTADQNTEQIPAPYAKEKIAALAGVNPRSKAYQNRLMLIKVEYVAAFGMDEEPSAEQFRTLLERDGAMALFTPEKLQHSWREAAVRIHPFHHVMMALPPDIMTEGSLKHAVAAAVAFYEKRKAEVAKIPNCFLVPIYEQNIAALQAATFAEYAAFRQRCMLLGVAPFDAVATARN